MEKKVRKKYDMPLTDAVELKLTSILMESGGNNPGEGGGSGTPGDPGEPI
jgi:hypothetical protein